MRERLTQNKGLSGQVSQERTWHGQRDGRLTFLLSYYSKSTSPEHLAKYCTVRKRTVLLLSLCANASGHLQVVNLQRRTLMLLLIIVLVLLFGGGGGYYGYSCSGSGGGFGVVGTVLLIVLVL